MAKHGVDFPKREEGGLFHIQQSALLVGISAYPIGSAMRLGISGISINKPDHSVLERDVRKAKRWDMGSEVSFVMKTCG